MATRSSCNLICSRYHSVCLSKDGYVESFGYSISGTHGHEENEVFTPTRIPTLKNIQQIATSEINITCLDYDGNVFTFGCNKYGQLGIGVDSDKLSYTYTPQKVNLPPCIQVSSGNYFTICLSEERLLYSFGINYTGELGIGYQNLKNYNTPQKITSLKEVEFIECGVDNHSFCKTLENEIYSWGGNSTGQLGLGNSRTQNSPMLCSSLSNEIIVDIKCGNFHTLVLTSNGDVLSCGDNEFGQLGRNIDGNYSSLFQKIEELSEIYKIECGFSHSMCIDVYNNLYVFGDSQYGQLGIQETEKIITPMKHPSLSNIY